MLCGKTLLFYLIESYDVGLVGLHVAYRQIFILHGDYTCKGWLISVGGLFRFEQSTCGVSGASHFRRKCFRRAFADDVSL